MPYLTPDELPEESACRSLLIPDNPDWLAIVSGAINELAQEWNWEQEGAVTTEEAAQAMLSMWMAFVESACGGICPTQYRVGEDGTIQQLEEDGETWVDTEFPAVPARTEPTDAEKQCLAARNAVEVLYQTYIELLDAWNTDSATQYGISTFLAVFGLLVSAWFGAPMLVINALINASLNVFGAGYALLGSLGADDWTVAFQEELVCLFLVHATLNPDDSVSFDYMAIRDNLSTLGGSPQLVFWLFYMFLIIGSDGLNAAGGTTSIEDYDCTGCFNWCYLWDFAETNGSWEMVTGERGVWVSGVGWTGQFYNVNSQELLVIKRTFSARPLTYIAWHQTLTNLGGPNGGVSYRLYLGGVLQLSAAMPMPWTGTNLALSAAISEIEADEVWIVINSGTQAATAEVYDMQIEGLGTNPIGDTNC